MCSNIAEESGTSALDCAATEDAVESTLTRVQIGTFSRDWRMPATRLVSWLNMLYWTLENSHKQSAVDLITLKNTEHHDEAHS